MLRKLFIVLFFVSTKLGDRLTIGHAACQPGLAKAASKVQRSRFVSNCYRGRVHPWLDSHSQTLLLVAMYCLLGLGNSYC